MSPECLYWVALCALVLPSVPFNRMALLVLAVWAFGHIVYRIVPFDDAACMFARIIATGAGAAWIVAHPCNNPRRAFAEIVAVILFVPAALLSAYSAIAFELPPETMADWQHRVIIYWSTWSIIMAQAIAIPFGNDWSKLKKFDEWIMARIVRHFGGVA